MNKMETTSAQSTGSQPSVTSNSAPEPAAPRSQQAEPLNVRAVLDRMLSEARLMGKLAIEEYDRDEIQWACGYEAALVKLERRLFGRPEKAQPAGNTPLSDAKHSDQR